MPCREHVQQLLQEKKRFDDLGVRILIVTFDSQAMAEHYVREFELPWPMLLDPQKSIYRKFGLGPASWWSLVGPRPMWGYIKLMLGGQRPGKPGSDLKQLGGDFILDNAGVMHYSHLCDDPLDRPAISLLIDEAQKVVGHQVDTSQ